MVLSAQPRLMRNPTLQFYTVPMKILQTILACSLVRGHAFPGPAYLHPTIHFTSPIVSNVEGWHDIAGALTHKGVHHIYQGQGWNHAVSRDLVHWSKSKYHGPTYINKTYKGMLSDEAPCLSGFLTKDVDGTVCAGFRQCSSEHGAGNAKHHPWDAPLELRCSLDDDMNFWSEHPDYLFNVTFYRGVPYDPARPWVDADGKWYMLLSFDACNATTQKLPCLAGGELHMWSSKKLRGSGAEWEHLGPVLRSNATVLKIGNLTSEFVTIDYVGMLEGDPSPAHNTRVFFNNVVGEGCCSGTTSYFVVTQKEPGAPMTQVAPQQMVDWGAFTPLAHPPSGAMGVERLIGTASRGFSMARTLGSEEANQVTKPGRRVMIGWTGPSNMGILKGEGSAQSLPRDLSLGPDRLLRQRFAQELQSLRVHRMVGTVGRVVDAGLQAEILACFLAPCDTGLQAPDFGLSVLGEGGARGASTRILLSPSTGLVSVDASLQGNPQVRAGPLPAALPSDLGCEWVVHAILDHAILELIVNNITALVVYVAPSANASQVELIGAGSRQRVLGKLDVWRLSSAHVPHKLTDIYV